MQRIASHLIIFLIGLLLTACVSSIDTNLPYADLPTITVGAEVTLVASPTHPTAYLPADPIPAGELVQVVGTNDDNSWLLVLRDGTLGWMPTIFSRTNVAKLQAAITFKPPTESCDEYIDTITGLDQTWDNARRSSVTVVGSILRSDISDDFDNAALSIRLTGPGAVTSSDFIHTPLTAKSALILFTYSIEGSDRSSNIGFDLAKAGNEDVNFQATFFGNTCAETYTTLNVGMQRTLSPEPKITPQTGRSAETTPTSTVSPTPPLLRQPTSTPTPTQTGASDTSSGTILENGGSWYQNNWELNLSARIDIAADSGPAVELTIFLTNNKTQDVAVSYNLASSVMAVDNLGRGLKLQHAHAASYLFGFRSFQEIVHPGETILLRSYVHVDSPPSMYVLADVAEPSVTEIIVTVNVASIKDAKWRIEIPH